MSNLQICRRQTPNAPRLGFTLPSAYQPVRVLVGASLPGMVRMGEIDVYACGHGKLLMSCELLAVVQSQGYALVFRNCHERLLHPAPHDRLVLASHLAENHVQAAAFDKADKMSTPPLYQVPLPVPDPVTGLGLLRPLDDHPLVQDAPPALSGGAAPPASPPGAGKKPPELGSKDWPPATPPARGGKLVRLLRLVSVAALVPPELAANRGRCPAK